MNRRTSIFMGIGCGLLLLILLVPLALGALILGGLDNLVPDLAVAPRTNPTNDSLFNPPNQNDSRPSLGLQATPTSQNLPETLPQTGGELEVTAEEMQLTQLYVQANPGVVNIQVQVSQMGQEGLGAGSGFIIDDLGHIVTNNHVVQGTSQVIVGFYNGVEARAEVIGTDPQSDLAIIKVETLPEGAHPLPLANSDDVQVGQNVVAIGNPFGLGSSMTSGIISAVGRVIPSGFSQFSIPNAIQTDAPINPGNSGGPLLNLRGEVIGVNAQIQLADPGVRGNVGIGFAIPSNILALVGPTLINKGTYEWPWLGVSGTRVNEFIMEANNLPNQQGAYIELVVSGGPAEAAGLRGTRSQVNIQGVPVPTGGDVVIAIDGQPIYSFDDLLTIIAFNQPGNQVTLTILRQGETVELPVTLQKRPSSIRQP